MKKNISTQMLLTSFSIQHNLAARGEPYHYRKEGGRVSSHDDNGGEGKRIGRGVCGEMQRTYNRSKHRGKLLDDRDEEGEREGARIERHNEYSYNAQREESQPEWRHKSRQQRHEAHGEANADYHRHARGQVSRQ